MCSAPSLRIDAFDAEAGPLPDLDGMLQQGRATFLTTRVGSEKECLALNDDSKQALVQAFSAVRRGDVDLPTARAAGAILAKALPHGWLGGLTKKDRVEFTSEQTWLLSDVPWELAFLQPQAGNADGELAEPALLRHLGLEVDQPPLATRPVGLVALAQLSSPRDAILRPRQFIPGIRNVLRRSPPLYMAPEVGGEPDPPFLSYPRFLQTLRTIQPDVLILAAHGTAVRQPTIFFESEADPGQPTPKPLHDLMHDLEGVKKPKLAVFLCCDLARGSEFAPPAITALVTGGVAEAVVMQGIVHQWVAERFVKEMMLHLQARDGLAEAVRSGRETIHRENRAQAILPAAFSAWDGAASIARWEAMRRAYRAGLQDFNRSSLPRLPWDQGEKRRRALSDLCEEPGIHIVIAPYSPEPRFIYGPFLDLKAHQGSEAAAGVRRPLIVVSGEPGINARDNDLPRWTAVLKEVSASLAEVVKAHIAPPGLDSSLVDAKTPQEAARSLARAVDDFGVSLVVAPVEIAGAHADSDEEFWHELLAYMRAGSTNGVIVLVPAPKRLNEVAKALGDLSDSTNIPPLSPSEIDEILARLSDAPQAPDAGFSGEKLHARTGGNPYLINLVREAIAEDYPCKDLEELLTADPEKVALTASTVLLNLVTEDPHLGFYALAQVDGSTSLRAIVTAFFEGNIQPLRTAQKLGILARSVEDLQGEESALVFLPSDIAAAMKSLLERENPEVSLRAAEISYDALNDPGAVERAARLPGGVRVLAAAQRLWIDAWWKTNDRDYYQLAGNMAIRLVDLDRALPLRPRRVTVGILQCAIDLGKSERQRVPESDCDHINFLAYSAANLLYRHGSTAEALEQLDGLIGDLHSLPTSVALAAGTLKADILKDLQQHGGVAELLSLLDEVIARASEELADPERDVEASAELKEILRDTQYTRIKCEIFLQGAEVNETSPRFAKLLADAETRPVALATLVERELRNDPPDWTRLEDWADRAEKALITPSSPRHRHAAYCYYQLAQFSRRRTPAELRAATAFYKECIAAARGFSPEYEALGLTRLVEIMTHLEHPAPKVAVMLKDLESAVEAVKRGDAGLAVENAFSARVLVRAQHQLAKCVRDAKKALSFCHGAANAALAPVLRTERDKYFFAQSLATFLERAQDLEAHYMWTRSFLHQVEQRTKDWLEITVDPDDHAKTKAVISDWLAEHGSRS